jgi:flavodoxin
MDSQSEQGGESMNTLVVYDSQFGNTERIALKIAETLGEFGVSRAIRVAEFSNDALRDINLLVLGCPTQAWHSTPNMQTLVKALESEEPQGLAIAEFDTRLDKPRWLTGSAAKLMAKQLKDVGVSLVPPESFLVTGTEGPLQPGELERAEEWARELHEQFRTQMEPVVATM